MVLSKNARNCFPSCRIQSIKEMTKEEGLREQEQVAWKKVESKAIMKQFEGLRLLKSNHVTRQRGHSD
ncbi:unnamed protein product [Rhodiola kirilowii]